MAYVFSNYTQRHIFHLETDTLGTIQCSDLTGGMLSNVVKELKSNEMDSVVIARRLLREVGRHFDEGDRNEDGEDKDDTESALLTDEDVNKLSDEEIENFACEFVAHNEWLMTTNEGAHRSVIINEQGENDVSIQSMPVDLQKENTERDSDYLVRVLRHYFDVQAKRNKRLLKHFTGSNFNNIFSDATKDLLKQNVSLSDQLSTTLRGLNSSFTGPHSGSIAEPRHLDLTRHLDLKVPTIPENPVHETNRRLSDVLDHAEELRPIILQLAELFRNMNDTALQMHADFNRSARKSLIVSILVACIATVSLVVAALYSWWSYEQSTVQKAQYQRDFREQQAHFQTLIELQDDRYRQLLGNQDKQLETLIKRQDAQYEKIIDSLRVSNTIQSEKDR